MLIKLQLDQLVDSAPLEQWPFDNHMNCLNFGVEIYDVYGVIIILQSAPVFVNILGLKLCQNVSWLCCLKWLTKYNIQFKEFGI